MLLSVGGNQASAQSGAAVQNPVTQSNLVQRMNQALKTNDKFWDLFGADDIWNKSFYLDIVVSNKGNEAFSGLGSMITEGLFKGEVTAYDASNEQFTTRLSKQDCINLLAHNSSNAISGFNPGAVARYRIKEELSFIANERKIVEKIVGIAPLMELKQPDGTTIQQPVMWFYYPDCREYLAKHTSDASGENWDNAFQSRHFFSTTNNTTTAADFKFSPEHYSGKSSLSK